MKKTKKNSLWIIFLLFLMVIHFIAALFRATAVLDVIGPFSSFFCGAALIVEYSKHNKTSLTEWVILLSSLACISYGIAETVWSLLDAYHIGDPASSPITIIPYFFATVFVFLSLAPPLSFIYRYWSGALIFVDVLLNLVVGGNLFWVLFFNQNVENINKLFLLDPTSIITLLMDFLVAVSALSLLIFLIRINGSVWHFTVISGVLLLTVTDIIYYFLLCNGRYITDSVVDLFYFLSFDIITAGLLWGSGKSAQTRDLSLSKVKLRKSVFLFILIYPLALFLGFATKLATAPLTADNVMNLCVVMFAYVVGNQYIVKSLALEQHLKEDKARLEKEKEEQIQRAEYLHDHDATTGFYNKLYFFNRLHECSKIWSKESVILAVIEIPQIDLVYEVLGQENVKNAIVSIADRINQLKNGDAVIARTATNQFAVRILGEYTKEKAEDLCSTIKSLFAEPVRIDKTPFFFSANVGMVFECCDQECGRSIDCARLMQDASAALRLARTSKDHTYLLISSHETIDLHKKQEIELLLDRAVQNHEFLLYYQPQFEFPGQRLIGAEALIRWNTKEYGFIPPSLFIPIAEETGSIHELGRWVFQETVRQAAEWNMKYPLDLKISFNISTKQLDDPGFLSFLSAELEKQRVSPMRLDAEITESHAVAKSEVIYSFFEFCKKENISVSLDDFGSGFSTAANFSKYTYDRIKIDKSLVDEILVNNEKARHFIQSTVEMARISKSVCLAEGVEKQEQLDALLALGCNQIQGYLLGRPVPADIFEKDYIMPNIKGA